MEEDKKSIGAWVERLFNKHKFMRRFTMFWAMALVTYIVVERHDMQTGSFVAVVGLVATAIGLYQWDKMLDKK